MLPVARRFEYGCWTHTFRHMSGNKTAHQRVADWKAKGIPRALWPDVGQAAIERAHDGIWKATVERLAGEAPTIELGQDSQRPLSIAATISGMGPLLGYWQESGEIACDPFTSQLLLAHLDHARRRAFKMETALTDILTICRDRSIKPIVMKGTFTARRYFPESGTRPQADIDLLIRPEDLDGMREALRSIDFRQIGEPSFGAETWEPPGSPSTVHSVEMEHAENPWSVDLHTTIDRPYFRGRWSHFGNVVFAVTERWMVRQRPALVFGQPLLLAHLAYHASRDINRVRLVRLVELVLVMRQDRRLDWDACLKLLDESGVKRLVYPAFALADRMAPGCVQASFLHALAETATQRIRRATDRLYQHPLRAYFKRRPSERLMWADGPFETLMCWSDILWPMGRSLPDQLRMLKRRLHMAAGRTRSQ